jgi:hypothetical protein
VGVCVRPYGAIRIYWTNEAQRMITSINAAMDDVFGQGTADAHDFSISGNSFFL